MKRNETKRRGRCDRIGSVAVASIRIRAVRCLGMFCSFSSSGSGVWNHGLASPVSELACYFCVGFDTVCLPVWCDRGAQLIFYHRTLSVWVVHVDRASLHIRSSSII